MPTIIRTRILAEADKITILVWTSVVTLNNWKVACIFSARLYQLRNSGKKCFLKDTFSGELWFVGCAFHTTSHIHIGKIAVSFLA
jgi:hypothetical protein